MANDIIHTVVGRVLTHRESQLFSYLGDERQAIALAKIVWLRQEATQAEIEAAVTVAFVHAYEAKGGNRNRITIEYVGGQRRDNLRGKC